MAPVADFDGDVRLAILSEFLEGRRPSVSSVAAAVDAAEDDVAAAFDRLAAGRAIVLTRGTHDIRMAAPFSGIRTDHQVTTGARRYYANCVWDALGVPAMLAAAGRPGDSAIETRCADCDATLRLDVRGGRLAADPTRPVAHFAVPAAKWWADIAFT